MNLMIEKRFELVFTGGDTFITDNESHINHFVGFEDVRGDFKCIVDCLNTLHEENIELVTKCNELKKENEQLKQENRKLKEDLEHCANQFTNDGKNVLLSLR